MLDYTAIGAGNVERCGNADAEHALAFELDWDGAALQDRGLSGGFCGCHLQGVRFSCHDFGATSMKIANSAPSGGCNDLSLIGKDRYDGIDLSSDLISDLLKEPCVQ
jgi:hypothetical protein